MAPRPTRARRARAPRQPTGEIQLQSPPALTRGSHQAALQMLFLLPMMLGMGAMSFVYIGRDGGAMTYVFGGLFVVVTVGMIVTTLAGGGRATRTKINEERRDYQRYLAGLRRRVREVAGQQRAALFFAQPDPGDLWTFVEGERLWERSRSDPDFGQVRLGLGPQRLATRLRAPQTVPLEDLDPVSSTSLRHFIRAHSTVPDLPVAISLRSFARVELVGDRARSLDLLRALLAQTVVFHSPVDLRLALCLAWDRHADWEWVKWLPHAQDPAAADAAGPGRLVADNLDALADLLGADLGDRPAFTRRTGMGFDHAHLLVVVDGGRTHGDTRLAPAGGRHGVTVVVVSEVDPATPPDPTALRLRVAGERMGRMTGAGSEARVEFLGRPDRLDEASAEALARAMTPRHRAVTTARSSAPTVFGLAGLLGINDPRDVDTRVTWRPRAPRDRLRVPIGLDPEGRPVELDLKESAEGGMGPHGLVIGATGSGKSELLRTLVTGLAVTHSSETLNLALIDFKGGATFAGMTGLPHTCAVITNLADDLTLVDRMADALNGELVRRQELLRAAGNFASVRDYERAREGGANLAPLPSLLVIIDEFSELLSSRPEFVDLFVMIGRLGRSLAVHLLLASQRLEEGRLHGLEAHLSYRIGLRTFSSSESRTVLGVPDAYHLPAIPGSGYLKSGTDTLQRFKAAYVSGELPPRAAGPAAAPPPGRRVLPFALARVEPPDTAPAAQNPSATPANGGGNGGGSGGGSGGGETIMGAMISRLVGNGPPAHQIWLPPLDRPPTLDQVLPPLGIDPARGLCPVGWEGNGRLMVPVAVVDKPFEQRRDLMWADLAGAGGNALVLGAPRSGKSTLLRTLVATLALTHTPQEVQCFLLDMGGGALGPVAGLPHVSGHAPRRDPERCRRLVAEVTTILEERETLFAEHGIDSITTFRARRAEVAPLVHDQREFGDVFLVVDDWGTLREEYENLEEAITRLALRGLGLGVHVVISANRWMTVRSQLLDALGTRWELRLGDPSDSLVSRRAAENVPVGAPGRGLTPEGLHFLGALPRLDSDQDPGTLAAGTADLVGRITEAWPGRPAPPVRLLPREVPYEEMPTAAERPGRAVPFALAESDLKPVFLDFDLEPHFLAFADVGSGKTALLRTVAAGLVRRYTPEEAAILVVDYRRGLLDAVRGDHLLGYAGSGPALEGYVTQVAQAMRERLPGPDVTPDRLRARDWWSGPELFLLVDDYELVAAQASMSHPLAPLLEFLPQARDIGLHLVVARGSGGAARGMFDPVLTRIKELGSPGLVMSGSRDEGVLLGDVKTTPQPPGRGYLVSRRTGTELVQVAWTPPHQ
ncbi:DNA segregation ATPase FtsK/SpoIIIE, S-DNA-T family [Streptoalloteichus tenebrarius]|uniref:DNA segregation ATPase FtsK/SpoIIIE, S-DNA-T family n=1 Tax=Streptoalloteichus tenebrarius (strain ATCC 17920 / DSM 40477 / JCM 4838 / CBS 697.72 / NBRC 16177 / NCIMB 11028 / NRRL B-12390 / A12253. 1 / ISP 5477) TaxID=1933 RepID=A0ABT1HUW3_STRSD|nr:type VII secretion protein EccCa [Streptoalloteichus tenebrarius]MCP2259304.1 DNA segregation ATPase FtsK/SpoIIIE, S-DNA-T family [Streptoalloteichus tenebrarius]BFE99067.1 type VII secretion protein EccC [Streptoalloteichus tenebrarius]